MNILIAMYKILSELQSPADSIFVFQNRLYIYAAKAKCKL